MDLFTPPSTFLWLGAAFSLKVASTGAIAILKSKIFGSEVMHA
jgi:hypothetical protein